MQGNKMSNLSDTEPFFFFFWAHRPDNRTVNWWIIQVNSMNIIKVGSSIEKYFTQPTVAVILLNSKSNVEFSGIFCNANPGRCWRSPFWVSLANQFVVCHRSWTYQSCCHGGLRHPQGREAASSKQATWSWGSITILEGQPKRITVQKCSSVDLHLTINPVQQLQAIAVPG